VYHVNHKTEKFSHIDVKEDVNILDSLKVSDHYNIRDTTKSNEVKCILVSSLEEITSIVKKDKGNIRFVLKNTDNMNPILFDIVDNHKVIPNVMRAGRNIVSISFKLDEESYYITRNTDDTSPEDTQHSIVGSTDVEMKEFTDEEIYDEYVKQDNKIYDALIKKDYLSEYSQDVLELESHYNMAPSSGFFGKKYPDDDVLNGVDMCKAYTTCVRDMKFVPVFGYFNRYEAYDNEPINPYFMYIVKNKFEKAAQVLLMDKYYDRLYGFVLLEAQKLGYTFQVKYVRKYSRLETVDFKTPIDEMYDSPVLSGESKKYIVNKTTGLWEKKYNKRNITKIFKTYEEAQAYQIKFLDAGVKSKIIVIDNTTYEIDQGTSSLYVTAREKAVKKYLYILDTYVETPLCDGFRQVKEIVYCMMKIKLYNLYNKCAMHGLNIAGVKTDCVLVRNTEQEILNSGIEFKNEFGGLKIDMLKTCVDKQLTVQYTKLVPMPDVKIIEIKDEYDDNEFKKVFDENNRILIKSELPGCGKTESVKRYCKETLFVCPFNELALEMKKEGYDVITAHMLLRINMTECAKAKMRIVDISKYKVICFDEIYLHNNYVKKRIDHYVKTHPKIKFIFTGDMNQNDPIGDIDEDAIDHDKVVNYIAPNQITLKINKRLKDPKEQDKLKKIKETIFDTNIPVMDTLRKYFKIKNIIDDVNTTMNLAYSNHRVDLINKNVQSKINVDKKKAVKINGAYFYPKLDVICRKALRSKDIKLFTNYVYRIIKINDKQVELREMFENVDITIPLNVFAKHFKLPYCRTGHSVQGKTIREPITIFECDSPYVSRRWVWTAITRCTSFDDVTIFEMSQDEIDDLSVWKTKLYFKLKIEGYMRQDKKANRGITDDYVSFEWFIEELNKCDYQCYFCKCPLEGKSENDTRTTNITADRIDCSISHTKDNCVLACVLCNQKRSNKNTVICV